MCKNFLAVLLVFGCLLTACAHSKKTAKSGTSTNPPVEAAEPKSSPAKAPGVPTSVSMTRGACFGRCPEYTVTIHSDGLAEYVSKRNATPAGSFQKNIGSDKAKKLLKEFMSYRADTCADRYEVKIADLPGLDFKLMINGKMKPIYNANFGPAYLTALSNEIDGLCKIDASWTKVAEEKKED